jgi:hypothetical protein
MSTDLHPDYPVVAGEYVLTKGWRLNLREQFNRRIDDDSLVLWRPELTFWINIWNNDGPASADEVLARLLADASPERSDEKVEKTQTVSRLSYELAEDDTERDESSGKSINGFIIYPKGYAQIAAYFDSAEARALAYEIIASVRSDN